MSSGADLVRLPEERWRGGGEKQWRLHVWPPLRLAVAQTVLV